MAEGCIAVRCRCSARVSFGPREVEAACPGCHALVRAPGLDRPYLLRWVDDLLARGKLLVSLDNKLSPRDTRAVSGLLAFLMILMFQLFTDLMG